MTKSATSQSQSRTEKRPSLIARLGVLRLRRVREYLTGYLMVAPSVILVFMFGIFPVGFALYVSLQKWRLKRTDFVGLKNFVGAVGNLAYVAAFALGIAAIVVAVLLVRRLRAEMQEKSDRTWWLAAAGLLHAAAIGSFVRWFVLLLPEVLDIADKIIGVEKTRELFNRLIGEAFRAETVLPAFYIFLLALALSIAAYVLSTRAWRSPRNAPYQARFTMSWLALGMGILLIVFTASQVVSAYATALELGEDPGIWPQIITISSGLLLLIAAWFVWRSAQNANSNRGFWLKILGALSRLVGGC